MKVKVGDQVFSGEDQRVMVILTPSDKENIKNMAPSAAQYCQYPDDEDACDIEAWMAVL